MITEDYVSFEIAKLLKEKGYDIPCNTYFVEVEKEMAKNKFKRKFYHSSVVANRNAYKSEMANHYYFSCPTLQMAMKWLRDEYNIDIVMFPHKRKKKTYYARVLRDFYIEHQQKCNTYSFYEEACEAAIKYCLEYLI